jgi:outer membrane protein OmpA-like peptidoglycan-associated protein
MKKVWITALACAVLFSLVSASPTIRGNRGVLRVYSADPELYSVRRPTMFLGFYQGYAKSDSLRELHYGFSFTLLAIQRFEFAYLIENLDSDFTPGEEPLSNEFKLKIVALKTPFLKVSPIGVAGFPIGGGTGDPWYGGHLAATFDLGAGQKILPLRIHGNAGYLTSGGNSTIPVSGALVYPTKFVDLFVEGGIPDTDNTDRMVFTPGIKVKLWGVRVTGGYDIYTEGEPENKFNFMFSWLGPFSGAEVIPEIGIGTIAGYVYDKKTEEPLEADILLEGDINRASNSDDTGNFTLDELPPGEYTVIVSADGYERGIIESEVERGKKTKLRIGLDPMVSSYAGTVIDAETEAPLPAQISIIPKVNRTIAADSTGAFFTELDAGGYEVTIYHEGYNPVWDSISIKPQKKTERHYSLDRIEKGGLYNGWILDHDTEEPIGALIRLDDRTFILNDSLTGEFAALLEEGSYGVNITKDDYLPKDDEFDITEDETTNRTYLLEKYKEVVEEEEEEEEVVIAFRDIIFEFDRSYIKKEYYSELDSLAALLNETDESIIVKLTGHTCYLGSDAYNMELSRRRVMAVKDYLINKGVKEDRLSVDHLGESKPKHDNATEEGRQKNRRVEISE